MSNKNHTLGIAEAFFSIQGEGQTMGIPAYFIRLISCNLSCGVTKEIFKKGKKENWTQEEFIANQSKDAKWCCDTLSVWSHGTKRSFDEVIEMLGGNKFITNLKDGAHIVITGGEPMLVQDSVIAFINYLIAQYRVIPIVEIETNGTILPFTELDKLVSFWNVSPKLSNSGHTHQERVNDVALKYFNSLDEKAIFKFVVGDESDWLEIIAEFVSALDLNPRKIVLMPAADNRTELINISEKVAQICIDNNLRFSSRLHIVNWDKKTGV